ncbi:alkaline phosphatase D family protein [Parvularcula lutaonensis]|uniref:Alkaline phosphatase D family protein n=1 Tax=Parvularcula lutaonensis TaxID=491923 RepID=A0ABV7MAY8_9PROT|nr:alkaline phosphatase D family protein [Parvularcula lutaonensis]GGY45927.1 hypothetical protein GCM10007148_13730 [Parvularcula lutaonensis]
MNFLRFTSAALALAACSTAPVIEEAGVPPRPLEPWSQVEPMASAPLDRSAPVTRIAFGSCIKQKDPLDVLDVIAARDPDLAVLLGDNVYGDVWDLADANLTELVVAYQDLAAREEFTRFREEIPLLVTWDDHDYGQNDQGGNYPRKFETEKIFENAWALPSDDERRARDGVYTSEVLGPEGQRLQIILLDTRFFRSDLTRTDERNAPGKERYVPSADPEQTMLGAEQERWLAEVLAQPADLRILVSSIQVIAEGHGWEAWRTLPLARERLYDTIDKSGVRNIVMVSGDRHLGGIYLEKETTGFPLYELTASSINAPQSIWRERDGNTSIEPGPKRLGDPVYTINYGEIEIDWEARTVDLSVRNEWGAAVREATLGF